MKTITTSQGEFYFIDPKTRSYMKELKTFWEGNDNNSNIFCIEVIGKCSEIIKDEELAKRVVECIYLKPDGYLYFNYTDSHKGILNHFNFTKVKATESFASLLQANDIWLENPYGEKPTPSYKVLWDEEGDEELYNWEQAKQKVGDWLVIKKG